MIGYTFVFLQIAIILALLGNNYFFHEMKIKNEKPQVKKK